jgi:hypothetical protein
MNPSRKAYEVRNGSHVAFMVTMLVCEVFLIATLLGGCAAAPTSLETLPSPPGDFVMNIAQAAAPAKQV